MNGQPTPAGPAPDPLLEEIRRVRQDIWEESGRDLDRLFERLRRIESEQRRAGRAIVEPSEPESAAPDQVA